MHYLRHSVKDGCNLYEVSPFLAWIGRKIYGVPNYNMDSQRLFAILYEYTFIFFFLPVLSTDRNSSGIHIHLLVSLQIPVTEFRRQAPADVPN